MFQQVSHVIAKDKVLTLESKKDGDEIFFTDIITFDCVFNLANLKLLL